MQKFLHSQLGVQTILANLANDWAVTTLPRSVTAITNLHPRRSSQWTYFNLINYDRSTGKRQGPWIQNAVWRSNRQLPSSTILLFNVFAIFSNNYFAIILTNQCTQTTQQCQILIKLKNHIANFKVATLRFQFPQKATPCALCLPTTYCKNWKLCVKKKQKLIDILWSKNKYSDDLLWLLLSNM